MLTTADIARGISIDYSDTQLEPDEALEHREAQRRYLEQDEREKRARLANAARGMAFGAVYQWTGYSKC